VEIIMKYLGYEEAKLSCIPPMAPKFECVDRYDTKFCVVDYFSKKGTDLKTCEASCGSQNDFTPEIFL
jgi:hypothetical protein